MHKLPFLTALLLISTSSMAQDDDGPGIPEDRMQEIKAQKAAYITSQMDLTPEEAQRFWPVYNKFDKELEAIRKEQRELMKEIKNKNSAGALTEADAQKFLDKEHVLRQRELDLRKKYMIEFRDLIGAVKTLRLGKAERDFNRELLRRARDKDGGPKGDGPPARRP